MNKIFVLLLVLFVLPSSASALTGTFVTPTPTNGEVIYDNQFTIKTLSTGGNPYFTVVDFNRTLVGWYQLEDLTDSSSYDNNLTCSVCPTPTTGVYGGGAMFDGLVSNITIGNIPQLDPSYTNEFTWAGWIYVNSTPNPLPRVIAKGTNRHYISIQNTAQHAHQGQLVLEVTNTSGGRFDYYANITPGTVDNNFSDPVNQLVWRFFAVTFSTVNNGSSQFIDPNAKWYLDGRKITTVYVTQQTASSFWNGNLYDQSNTSLFIGGVLTRPSNISLDNIMIFDRKLNDSEIFALYNATAPNYLQTYTNMSKGQYTIQAYFGEQNGSYLESSLITFTLAVNNAYTTARNSACGVFFSATSIISVILVVIVIGGFMIFFGLKEFVVNDTAGMAVGIIVLGVLIVVVVGLMGVTCSIL